MTWLNPDAEKSAFSAQVAGGANEQRRAMLDVALHDGGITISCWLPASAAAACMEAVACAWINSGCVLSHPRTDTHHTGSGPDAHPGCPKAPGSERSE